jgi:hypothetical protein
MARKRAAASDATALARRGYELAVAAQQYEQVIAAYGTLFLQLERQLGESEFVAKAEPAALARLEAVLEREIRPQERAVWEAFAELFGFAWGDRVRVVHPTHEPTDVEPTALVFNPPTGEPFALVQGRALRKDGQPGNRTAQAYLQPGVSTVTVLSPAARA